MKEAAAADWAGAAGLAMEAAAGWGRCWEEEAGSGWAVAAGLGMEEEADSGWVAALADWASEVGADGAQGASAKAALGLSAEEERVGAAERMKQK